MSRHGREMVGAVAEGMGRAHAEYRAARASRARSRARGLSAMGSGADYHYANESQYLLMMELARDADRNDQVLGQGIDRLVDLVFREGMQLDPDSGNEELNAILSADWRDWSEERELCDVSGEESLHGLARLALRHMVVDGDHGILLLDSGHVQGAETHRMRTPSNVRNDRRKRRVVHGVELSGARRPIRYWFTKENVGFDTRIERVSDMVKYDAYDEAGYRQVLHIKRKRRMSQTRGVSLLAPVLETAAQHDDLQWAQLVKAQVAACFAVFREQAAAAGLPTSGAQLGSRSTETVDDFVKVLDQISPGMIVTGRPGEKLQGYAPNVPNAEFFKHAKLVLTFISINLGIPLIVFLLDPSETNFSGWRGAMDAARPGLHKLRRLMVEQFYRPIYLWRVRRLLAEDSARGARVRALVAEGMDSRFRGNDGAVAPGTGPASPSATPGQAPIDVFRHSWKPPHDPYIEPLKDAQADQVIVTEGLNSRRNVLASRGLQIEEVDRHRVEDRKRLILMAQSAAEELVEAGAGDVTWRDLIPSDTKSEQMIHVAKLEAEAEEEGEEGEEDD